MNISMFGLLVLFYRDRLSCLRLGKIFFMFVGSMRLKVLFLFFVIYVIVGSIVFI